jgi:hypothetical protein
MSAGSSEHLYIWTIYRRGNGYIAKKWKVLATGAEPMSHEMASDNIDDLRKTFEGFGLVMIGRSEDDEIDIVESWI